MDKAKEQLREPLRIHFGYEAFRPGQERAIDDILAGRNALVIMPTGGGKSLCYQLPALILPGVTIVVSPLIALMKDQVDTLNRIGIPATLVNSSISPAESASRLEGVRQGKFKLLYIAPERFYNREFLEALKNIEVSLFAIDEAHCISQWGHDFRPSYMRLREAVEKLGHPTVIALTATATPEVKTDIIKQLGLIDPDTIVTGFGRPNLQFGAIQASNAKKAQIILDAVRSMPEASGIIYVGTRARADELLSLLLENQIEAAVYHAGMEPEDRKWVQDNFMSGKAKVIVATNAFGMGIDKRDIRFVIHHDMPGTIEAYYQEAGRAGRDGKPSFCLILYSPRDKYLQEFFIKGDNPPPQTILELYEILKDFGSDSVLITYAELSKMLSDDIPEMAVGTALKILEHEGYVSRSREKTNNAFVKLLKGFAEIQASLGVRSKKQIELLERLEARFGEELRSGWQVNLDETAEIIGLKKEALVRFFKKLAEQGAAEYVPPFKGTEINILKREPAEELKIDFSALKEKARKAYGKLDKMEEYVYHFGCRQAFILDYFGDHSLHACKKCDNCLNGPVRREITVPKKESPRRILSGRSLAGRKPVEAAPEILEAEEDKSQKAKLPTKLTQLETFDLYNKGLDIREIAKSRDLKTATIVEHLCFLLEKKLPVDIDRLVGKKKQKSILDAVAQAGSDKLAPIKERLGEEASWEDIKLVLAARRRS